MTDNAQHGASRPDTLLMLGPIYAMTSLLERLASKQLLTTEEAAEVLRDAGQQLRDMAEDGPLEEIAEGYAAIYDHYANGIHPED